MKLFMTGLAASLLCVPAFAQNTVAQGEALSQMHQTARLHFHNNATESQATVKDNLAVGAISRQSVYGTSNPYGYGYGNTTVVVPYPTYPAYGYPAPYPAYGYPAYPAYGYPAPYPAYGYPAYPSNAITSAPLTPAYPGQSPAYITSIPLGTTYYNNGPANCAPNYYNSYPSYGYGSYPPYGSRQSSNASVSIGNGNFRVKVGGSKTTIR